jgi:hypothetical protein
MHAYTNARILSLHLIYSSSASTLRSVHTINSPDKERKAPYRKLKQIALFNVGTCMILLAVLTPLCSTFQNVNAFNGFKRVSVLPPFAVYSRCDFVFPSIL